MRSDHSPLAFAYLRLSNEEKVAGESASITNQRRIAEDYCRQNGIRLIQVFADDGWSGGNFDRPEFKAMIRQLTEGRANMVITKDLSRLGRDMRESSYYAEQFFPEHGVRYIAINDHFDTEQENILAPFQFAMNEVYLRDGSRKVREVLKSKREQGLYCACPPYGYRKNPRDKNRLQPDERTAPIVQRIFQAAAQGDSARKITLALNRDGVIPPLKYRVLYRDDFTAEGAAHASDLWNYTTVKRILKNPVYLGHTVLGKSKKASVKSTKPLAVPRDNWAVTKNTHAPLVTQTLFHAAQQNLGKGRAQYMAQDHVRKSIFAGIAVCGLCGHSLCSCGTVYKGERLKYWHLSCTHQRQDIGTPCTGVRIRYADLLEIVRQDLNQILSMDETAVRALVDQALNRVKAEETDTSRPLQKERAQARLRIIDRMIAKLYTDNAEGNLDDDRLRRLVSDLETEAAELNRLLASLNAPSRIAETAERFRQFFDLARQSTHIETLDRKTLLTFVDRIEIGPKELADGYVKATHRSTPFTQSIRIHYKFIGELDADSVRHFPEASGI